MTGPFSQAHLYQDPARTKLILEYLKAPKIQYFLDEKGGNYAKFDEMAILADDFQDRGMFDLEFAYRYMAEKKTVPHVGYRRIEFDDIDTHQVRRISEIVFDHYTVYEETFPGYASAPQESKLPCWFFTQPEIDYLSLGPYVAPEERIVVFRNFYGCSTEPRHELDLLTQTIRTFLTRSKVWKWMFIRLIQVYYSFPTLYRRMIES